MSTDLEQALLKGMVTFGRAALTADFSERIVWYCAGLESILLRDSDQIVSNLSERLAVFSYDTVDERFAARADVKKAYSLRSGFVHRGVEIGESEIVTPVRSSRSAGLQSDRPKRRQLQQQERAP